MSARIRHGTGTGTSARIRMQGPFLAAPSAFQIGNELPSCLLSIDYRDPKRNARNRLLRRCNEQGGCIYGCIVQRAAVYPTQLSSILL